MVKYRSRINRRRRAKCLIKSSAPTRSPRACGPSPKNIACRPFTFSVPTARGEADETSDLDFLVFGGEHFKPTLIFAFAEELRAALEKEIDVFEISEINTDSVFYDTIMKERLQVA